MEFKIESCTMLLHISCMICWPYRENIQFSGIKLRFATNPRYIRSLYQIVSKFVQPLRLTAYHKNGCQKYLNSAIVPRATNELLKPRYDCFMHLEFALVFHVFSTSSFGDLSEIANDSRIAIQLRRRTLNFARSLCCRIA